MVCCICGSRISTESAHIPMQLGDDELRCCSDCAEKIKRTEHCVRFLSDFDLERFINPLEETTVKDIRNMF